MHNKNIKSHYNNLKSFKLQDRHKSKIINIRNINNFIKSVLIKKYTKTDVLDLGCGKGGDLKKFMRTDIKYYCGIDIAENSVEEAVNRYKQMVDRNSNEKDRSERKGMGNNNGTSQEEQNYTEKNKTDKIDNNKIENDNNVNNNNKIDNSIDNKTMGNSKIENIKTENNKNVSINTDTNYNNRNNDNNINIETENNTAESKYESNTNVEKTINKNKENYRTENISLENKTESNNHIEPNECEDKYKVNTETNINNINNEIKQKAESTKNETIQKQSNQFTNNSNLFDANFICADAYNEPFNLHHRFDTISCQFSFHYAFASQDTFNTTITNIDRHLNNNGHFILTIPNSDTLLRRYKRHKNNFGNEYYKIKFRNTYEEIKEMQFGIEYFFVLKEAIDNCVEYLVDFKVMKNALSECGIECVMYMDFLAFFNRNVKQNMEMYNAMVRGRLNSEELKVIELYSVAVFKKTGECKSPKTSVNDM